MDFTHLEKTATRMRQLIVESIGIAGSGHPGGSLSIVEILTYLYFHRARLNEDPRWSERDRIILSKGHAAPALYAALALRGYLPQEEVKSLRKLGSRLQGHPDMHKLPGVEMSTGSLGQGLSIANGLALGLRLQGLHNKVFAILGDGELQEGQIWEAAMTAAHYKLSNLTAFIDYNGLQIDGKTSEVKNIAPLPDKWRAFGWEVVEIDGHCFKALHAACESSGNKPLAVIARTVKGKGVSYMENEADWHGKAPSKTQIQEYLAGEVAR